MFQIVTMGIEIIFVASIEKLVPSWVSEGCQGVKKEVKYVENPTYWKYYKQDMKKLHHN